MCVQERGSCNFTLCSITTEVKTFCVCVFAISVLNSYPPLLQASLNEGNTPYFVDDNDDSEEDVSNEDDDDDDGCV